MLSTFSGNNKTLYTLTKCICDISWLTQTNPNSGYCQSELYKSSIKRHNKRQKHSSNIYQTTSVGSQQYLWPQSKADSLFMSESLIENSKIPAFPFILSGCDDLGSTGTPCCTAQRNRTWKAPKS